MELDRRRRRRELTRGAINIALSWGVLFGAYYRLVPSRDFGSAGAALRLALAMAIVCGVIAVEVFRILHAEFPGLRALEGIGIIIPLFIVVFAELYVAMSHSSPGTFSQPLDHTSALYFTVTVLATVGFGDIVPKTDPARGIVTIQMVLDLIVLGLLVRLLIGAVKVAQDRRE
jgi:hypothetical protein